MFKKASCTVYQKIKATLISRVAVPYYLLYSMSYYIINTIYAVAYYFVLACFFKCNFSFQFNFGLDFSSFMCFCYFFFFIKLKVN